MLPPAAAILLLKIYNILEIGRYGIISKGGEAGDSAFERRREVIITVLLVLAHWKHSYSPKEFGHKESFCEAF